MKRLVIGLLAHVDSGKTTLAEGLLYRAGVLRKLGRVDHKDAFLDTDAQERARGITIFSKQAMLTLPAQPDAEEYNTQVKQAVAAGRNAQAPDVPANALGLPAEPEQHAGKQPLRDQRIAAAQQFFQQKLYARIQ